MMPHGLVWSAFMASIELDKECVQALAIVGGTVIAVAALVLDGDLGYAMGTGILSLGSGVVGYLFGKTGGGPSEVAQIQ